MNMLIRVAGAAGLVLLGAACSGGGSTDDSPVPTPAPTTAAASESAPDPTLIDGKYEGYALGSSKPNCADAVAFWGGDLSGPGTAVTVAVAGPLTVAVDITLKSGGHVSDGATVPAGEDQHAFHFAAVKRNDVRRVQVDASNSPVNKGGTCAAPFGDTDIPDPSRG